MPFLQFCNAVNFDSPVSRQIAAVTAARLISVLAQFGGSCLEQLVADNAPTAMTRFLATDLCNTRQVKFWLAQLIDPRTRNLQYEVHMTSTADRRAYTDSQCNRHSRVFAAVPRHMS